MKFCNNPASYEASIPALSPMKGKVEMKIYGNELNIVLDVRQTGGGLQLSIQEIGNSINDVTRTIGTVTLANYRVRNDLLPIVQNVVSELQAAEDKALGKGAS